MGRQVISKVDKQYNTVQYNADFYSAVSRKRIGGAWRQCL